MGIFFDAHPQDGTVRFFHEAIDGPRHIPTWKSEEERKAGKRPVLIYNPDTRIPQGASEISTDRFEELMAAQQGGAQIVLSRGMPSAVPRTLSPEEHRAARRRRRDQMLAASDWTQLPDSPLSSSEQAEWAEYRYSLRNLDMDGDSWPAAPGGSN